MLGPDALHTARTVVAVTPNDATPLATPAKALYVGVTGNVSVITKGGQTVTFVGVPAGGYVLAQCTHVRTTGTTASSILALS